jgi:actin-like ATPase involved in cell morphogenesis
MSEALGLSIGTASLVAARAGGVPVSRRSVLTVSDQRKSEVGLPDENPNSDEAGLVIRGFVERVGDRAPLVAADGKRYIGAALTVEALEAMARIVGFGQPIAIAVPAYWADGQTAALRNELLARPALAPNGVQPLLVSDARAAATALYAKPGFPTNGVLVLCDFGASGASVSLILPGSNFQQIGQSVRHAGFSGNEIDQLIANHLQAKARNARTVSLNEALRSGSPVLPARDCRRVKEQLSVVDVSAIGTGAGGDVGLSRGDFEQIISQPLDRFIAAIEETLQRNRIPRGDLTAVATVGGGASIPFVTARLSGRLRVPVFTAPQPPFAAAVGAAIFARQQSSGDARRAPSPAVKTPPDNVGTPPTMANMPPTMANMPPTMANMPPTMASPPPARVVPPPAPAGSPTTPAGNPTTPAGNPTTPAGTPPTQTAPTAFSGERAADAGSAPGALAWSEESGTGQEPIPYTGPEHADEHVEEPISDHKEELSSPPQRVKRPWYKRTALIMTLAGTGAAVLAAGGLALSLSNSKTSPTQTTTPSQPETSQVTTTTEPSTAATTTTTEEPPPTSELPATTTYIPPPPSTFQPTRTNPPPTTTPSQKNSKSSQPPSPSSTTKTHGPFFPPPFGPPTPKH